MWNDIDLVRLVTPLFILGLSHVWQLLVSQQ